MCRGEPGKSWQSQTIFRSLKRFFELIMECQVRLLRVSELKFCLYQKEKKKWVQWPWYAEDFLNRQCLKRFTARPLLRAEMGPAKDLSWRNCACDDAARHILQMINYHWSLFYFKSEEEFGPHGAPYSWPQLHGFFPASGTHWALLCFAH